MASQIAVSRDLLPPGAGLSATVTIIPRDAAGVALGPGHKLRLTTTAGRLSAAHGRYEVTLEPAGARAGTTARLTATVDGVQLAYRPRVFFTTRRDFIGQPFRARGGGCSAGGRHPCFRSRGCCCSCC